MDVGTDVVELSYYDQNYFVIKLVHTLKSAYRLSLNQRHRYGVTKQLRLFWAVIFMEY